MLLLLAWLPINENMPVYFGNRELRKTQFFVNLSNNYNYLENSIVGGVL